MSKIRDKMLVEIVLGSILSLVSPLCFADTDIGGRPEKSDVIVTYPQPSGALTPVWVAYEAGLFKKYGLTAKLQLLNPQVSAQALLADDADFYAAGSDLINARLKGARVKYFGATLQRFIFQMWGAKEITSLQQLKGKTVAVTTPRTALDSATREVLIRNGLIPDKDVKVLYVQTVPAVLSAVINRKTDAGSLSAPNTLKARDAGLNLLVDIGKLNVAGFQVAYGTTEKYLKNNPNIIYAFLKAIAEAVVVSKKDSLMAKKAIAKYAQLDDPRLVDGTYDQFAPYWDMGLAIEQRVIEAQLNYLDEKEFPQAKNAEPKDFFDNSFVEKLEKSGFFQKVGLIRE